MKNHTKSKIDQSFSAHLDEKYPDLPQHLRRKIAHDLTDIANKYLIENNDGLADLLKEAFMDVETHKKMFKDHIDDIQVSTKAILDILRKQGMIGYEQDPKTRKTIVVGKTKVLTETVAYLNRLNSFVIEFYENVYKIEDTKDSPQTTLF